MKRLNFMMISAMYENGGNTTQRMLDGHPELMVYPFESQLGTSLTADYFTSFVPFRYRWPEFPLSGKPAQDYELFFDEEMKARLRVPDRSKFRNAEMELKEAERKELFCKYMDGKPRTRTNLVEAFFYSSFESWKNMKKSGQEKAWVGYSPVIVLDTEKMMADFPEGHVIHVVRHPCAGYADTKKRPYPISLERYVWTWNVCQHMALTYAERFPNNFHLVRFEDLVADPKATMTKLCKRLGIGFSENTLYPSWNATKMQEVYPWGTIRTPTTEANIATMKELSAAETKDVKSLASVMMKALNYQDM